MFVSVMAFRSIRLLAFTAKDVMPKRRDPDAKASFQVQMFGVGEDGETSSLTVTGYKPFFYARVGDDWTATQVHAFVSQMEEDMDGDYEGSITGSRLVTRKTLYGFDGGKAHRFVRLQFANERSMRKAKQLWYLPACGNRREPVLSPDGYDYEGCGTRLYEAQIPPLLRMFHIQEISPSGWIKIPLSKARRPRSKRTTCAWEASVAYEHIEAQPDKEARVPYKICSFDIEASSSHGDFPLPKKNYKKLATDLVDFWRIKKGRRPKSTMQMDDGDLAGIVGEAITHEHGKWEGKVDKVYVKSRPADAALSVALTKWVNCPYVKKRKADDGDEPKLSQIEDPEETIARTPRLTLRPDAAAAKALEAGPLAVLRCTDIGRELKIEALTQTLTKCLPDLRGDEVTFIGSTFFRNGDTVPYLNHCAVKDKCDDLPGTANSQIDCYDTEKEVLLAWTELIQKEDPDIIIGYNIFGFDYSFMYARAQELGCVRAFLRLSRNKGEVCLSSKWDCSSGKMREGLQESKVFLASGEHQLSYPAIAGRLQIDLYNVLRRDYQLTQYKLDYVASQFIGDRVSAITHADGRTLVKSGNLTGLTTGSFISFEEEAHSIDAYRDGQKFEVTDIERADGSFWIDSEEHPDMTKKVRWGLAKDDVTPQDIFRMTREGPGPRSMIAKYCIQDCNLVQHLLRKIDVLTGYIEMSSLCSVPMEFLVMRGQGIKLTSYISKKCREKNTLMEVIDKGKSDDAYEGAIVLEPKCDLYLEDPVACVDFSSLYPSSMISENISHDSKVWTKEYDLCGNLVAETGEQNEAGEFIYDNLPKYKYVDISYDTYLWRRKSARPGAAMEKRKVGNKVCRFAQFPEGRGIMPSILEELLAARKATRKMIPKQKDEFMKNVLDKRQLSIKVTANSMYGQTGAKTSSFYEQDCAASTTSAGRKLLTYAQRVIEEAYSEQEIEVEGELVRINAEYVYGDTDSVFFKFNLRELTGQKITGRRALKMTIHLAKEAGALATKFLKAPHDLEYEKTFLPFCLLSKKRYVGMLYEEDPDKCKRKSMGIVLKRRDNAPIVKDVYGGVIDILMKDKDIEKAAAFMQECLAKIVAGEYGIEKLIITKSLRSGYKNPQQIAHNVLAERIGRRDPGNKPRPGDRIAFAYIVNPDKKALQGDRIETPEYIAQRRLKLNYTFYITNQIMKPLQQVFALVLERLPAFERLKRGGVIGWERELAALRESQPDEEKRKKKEESMRNKEVKSLLFDDYLKTADRSRTGDQSIGGFFAALC